MSEEQKGKGVDTWAQAPAFSPVALRKLVSLAAQGYRVTGYAFSKPMEGAQPARGFIEHGGFVGWWRADPPECHYVPATDGASTPATEASKGGAVSGRENLIPLGRGMYIVRTQAGFKKALKTFDEYRAPSDVRGWPSSYPAFVALSDGYEGYHFTRAQCIPLPEFQAAIAAAAPRPPEAAPAGADPGPVADAMLFVEVLALATADVRQAFIEHGRDSAAVQEAEKRVERADDALRAFLQRHLQGVADGGD